MLIQRVSPKSNCEIVSVILKLVEFDPVLTCYYRPPTMTNMNPLADYLNSVRSLHPVSRVLLLGDFNMPDIKWNSSNKSDRLRAF